ncbi:MAG: hypothetical protein KKE96_02175 [Candidatus Altiarchaeota archaeon]|nr:hypothetical protein [Candidatus Altiarchaeota archaeon]
MMSWRYLEVKEDEVFKCNAIHSTLLDGMNKGVSPNTVFLEECPSNVLSLGRNQCAEEECDLDACNRLGVKLERRETGGGAGFMVPGNTAWGVCVSRSDASKDMMENFKRFSEGVIMGLKKLGLNANFTPINDINIDDKKIGGMTAMSKSNAVLVYGSVIWDLDFETYKQIAKIPAQKLKKKGVPSAQKRITTLTAELGRKIPPAELRQYLLQGFEESLGLKLEKKPLNDEEKKIWEEKTKQFRDLKFIFRPGHCSVSNASYIHPAEKGIIRVATYLEGDSIRAIGITGDFMQVNDIDFTGLEKALSGVNAERGAIEETVNKYFSENGVQLIGATADDFIEAILGAVEEFKK